MTTVAGYVDPDGVAWLAADTLAVMAPGDRKCLDDVEKIVRAGPWLVGVAGPVAVLRFLESRAETLAEVGHPGAIADMVWSNMRDLGWQPEMEGGVPAWPCELVIVSRNELWQVSRDGLAERERLFAAVGDGAPYAYGAWHAMDAHGVLSGPELLQAVMQAAAAFSPFTGPHFGALDGPYWTPRPVED